jgi:polyisoprenoid-binding protein YceI
MKTRIFLICLFSLTGVGALALTENLDVSGKTEFIATGKPGFIKIDGLGSGLTGSLKVAGNLVSGKATFPLSTLDTGVGLRDRHLKDEFLQVQKFPDAELTLNNVSLDKNPIANGFSQDKVPFTGILKVHGVSHPVNGTIDLSTAVGTTKGDAQFGIKISDFGFPEPKFMGMKVNDDVQVKVHLEATKTKAG